MYIVALLFYLFRITNSFINITVCNKQVITEESGIISTDKYPNHTEGLVKTFCIIEGPLETVTTIRILDLDLKNSDYSCKCCNYLELINRKSTPRKFCQEKKFSPIVMQGNTKLNFYANYTGHSNKGFAIHYSVKRKSLCKHSDYFCIHHDECFNFTQLCDGHSDCTDHSDELNCGICPKNYVPCSDLGKNCFHFVNDRCDGRMHCAAGEDEVSCSKQCAGSVLCNSGLGCFTPKNVCDNITHCEDRSDEANCTIKYCELHPDEDTFTCDNGNCIAKFLVKDGVDDCGDESDEKLTLHNILVLLSVIGGVLFGFFVAILCCWCNNRRDIEHLMADMPEFPLPPFRGPGESSADCNPTFEGADLHNDEEMFEAYLETRSESGGTRRRQRSARTIIVRPAQSCSIIKTNTNCTAITLASLGVSPEDCLDLDTKCGVHANNHFEFLESAVKIEVPSENPASMSSSTKSSRSRRLKRPRIGCAGDCTTAISVDTIELTSKPSTSKETDYQETIIDLEVT